LLYFLDQDIESFLEIEPDQGAFGLGPWPCLNKAATHYQQDVVNKLVIKRDYTSTNPVGEFSCSCGFIYARKGPDKTFKDKYRISYIEKYGDTWRTRVQELHKSGLSIYRISKDLEASPTTVGRQLKYCENSKENITTVNKEALIEKYRIELLMSMKRFPNYGRSELLEKFKKIYRFLSENDKEWFNSNMPNKRKKVQVGTVDWTKRDQEYYEKIKVLYKELLELDKPVRITRSAIGKRLNILERIEKRHVFKLPYTNQLLSEIIESVQDFQIRRCLKVIDEFLEDGEPVILWRVQKKCAVQLHDFKKIIPKLEEYLSREKERN